MAVSKSTVALVKCDSYEEVEVARAVEEGLSLLGGVSAFARPGERLLLKPNVLVGTKPEKCVTTHPSLLKAVGRILLDLKVEVCYGDSGAIASPERNTKRSGLRQVADELGIELADFEAGETVTYNEARVSRQFVVAKGVLQSDGVVSLCKLKTHGLTRLTGAVKNQFGCVPGILKSEYHVRLPDPYDFSMMLVDLTRFIAPRLYIMGAVWAMEGNGPRSGKPRKLGVLLFSADPVALDAIACQLIRLDPDVVPTLAAGEAAGLGTCRYDAIEIVGERAESFVCRDFEADRTRPVPTKGTFLRRLLRNRISQRPVLKADKCSKCGTCVEICPVDPKAIDWSAAGRGKPPRHAYARCVRCFCCQETCPEGAIVVAETVLGRVYRRLDTLNRRLVLPQLSDLDWRWWRS